MGYIYFPCFVLVLQEISLRRGNLLLKESGNGRQYEHQRPSGEQAGWTLCCTGRRRVEGSGVAGNGRNGERLAHSTSGNHWRGRGGGKDNEGGKSEKLKRTGVKANVGTEGGTGAEREALKYPWIREDHL